MSKRVWMTFVDTMSKTVLYRASDVLQQIATTSAKTTEGDVWKSKHI